MGVGRAAVFRGLVLAAAAAAAAVGWEVTHRCDPGQVRAAVAAALRAEFPGVGVEVGAARVSLFGGVSAADVRLTLAGEAEPFLAAPAAVIAHDKRALNGGRLVVRKVELDRPTVRLARRPDGSWNVAGLARAGPPAAGLGPTLVARDATVFVTDGRAGGLPPVVVSAARLTVVPDPPAAVRVDGRAVVAPADNSDPRLAVPVSAHVRWDRDGRAAAGRVEVPGLAVGPHLAPLLARLDPGWAELAGKVGATVGVTADVAVAAGRPPRYDVRLDVRDGSVTAAELPWPVDRLTARVRVADGRLTVERAAARAGPAAVEASLESRAGGPPDAVPPPAPLDRLERLDVAVRGLPVGPDLFARLPARADVVRTMLSPAGTVDLGFRFARAGGWRWRAEARPVRLGIVYDQFRYPVSDLAGWVAHTADDRGGEETRIELTGTAGGRPVDIRGTVSGPGPDPQIRARVSGGGCPVDDRLWAALPDRAGAALRQLRAAARADFVADIRQDLGVNRCDNTCRVTVYDGTVNHARFPYPLTGVGGEVTVRSAAVDPTRPLRPGLPLAPPADADRVELRGFVGRHAGGTVWLAGENEPAAGGRKLTLRVQGADCPVDADLLAAVGRLGLADAAAVLRPSGAVTFGAEVTAVDRSGAMATSAGGPAGPAGRPFDPAADLTLAAQFRGLGLAPTFLPLPFRDVGGVVRFADGKVDVERLTARHGGGRWRLDAARVQVPAAGPGVWANVGRLTAGPLDPADPHLRAALPDPVRAAVDGLDPRGRVDLRVRHLVVDATRPPAADPAGPPPGPTVYWDGEVRFAGAAVDAGVGWADLHGVVGSEGRVDDGRVGPVTGTVWVDRGTVGGQPVTAAKADYRVLPADPDPDRPGRLRPPAVEVPHLTARLFGGTVGGEAQVTLADPVRYRLGLTAAGVRLDQLAAHLGAADGAEVGGLAHAQVAVQNKPDPTTGRWVPTAAGRVDVPAGRMYNLPVLLPLLKLLKLRAPDQTAFDEAHAAFDLWGDRVTVSRLDLIGSAVSLAGRGHLDTRGDDVRFAFHPVWAPAVRGLLAPPAGADLAAAVAANLLRIDVTRKDGELAYEPHVLPLVTDPAKAVGDRVRRRLASTKAVLGP